MPVNKYRSIEEMPGPRWYEPGSPELDRAIHSAWDCALRAVGASLPPGLYKHRSITAAQEQRARWEKQQVAARRSE